MTRCLVALGSNLGDRLARLQELLNEQQRGFNESCVGKTFPALLEKPGRKPNQIIGRSPWLQSVILSTHDHAIGDMVKAKITSAGPNSLTGVAA